MRHNNNSEVSRYTFIATKDVASQKITLFKDVVHRDGKTTSTSTTQTLRTSPIKYITSAATLSQTSLIGDIVAVCEDGEVICLTGEKLVTQWSAGTQPLLRDAVNAPPAKLVVDYVTSGTVHELNDGLFKAQSEVFSALPKGLGPDATLLVVLVQGIEKERTSRYLMVLAAMPGSETTSSSTTQRLVTVDISPLPASNAPGKTAPQYEIDASSGLLLELGQAALKVHNLAGAVPKLKSIVQMDAADSFARLSKPFIVSCSSESISLYNYQYRSVHASSPLDLSELPADLQKRPCQLLSYFKTHDIVVGLIDNVLVSIQIESPSSHGKRRQGLLIDSIGRGAAVQLPSKRPRTVGKYDAFSKTLPGTITEEYLANFQTETEGADRLLADNDLAGWDDFMRSKFGMKIHRQEPQADGKADVKHEVEKETDAKASPEWHWPAGRKAYPAADRRWVLYAINQVYSIDSTDSSTLRPRLRLVLPDSNVTTYLALAGHLTQSNIKSAFRDDLDGVITDAKELAGDLVNCMAAADPSMALLLNYVQATRLGEVELLLVIRALMLSMDLIADPEKLESLRLLKSEPEPEREPDTENYEMDLDVLEQELALTEHYLGDENGSRSRGITLALSKLWRLSAIQTVKALRSTLKTEEILSIIQLLRLELVRGAWTSLYVDATNLDSDGNEPPPDGIITLIADLLGRCLDAIGAGGWLFNDAMSVADSAEAGDFLTALRLETTAALEGVEQAVSLCGIVGEAARYGLAAQKSGSFGRQSSSWNKALTMQLDGSSAAEGRPLPLGLKTKGWVSKDKVVAGGEVVQRSARETGLLLSQKVEAYSLEKLTV